MLFRSTALVACTVDEPRHLEIVGLWEKPDDQSAMGWRTPVHEVYAEIVEAFDRFNAVELAADPCRLEPRPAERRLGKECISWWSPCPYKK